MTESGGINCLFVNSINAWKWYKQVLSLIWVFFEVVYRKNSKHGRVFRVGSDCLIYRKIFTHLHTSYLQWQIVSTKVSKVSIKAALQPFVNWEIPFLKLKKTVKTQGFLPFFAECNYFKLEKKKLVTSHQF